MPPPAWKQNTILLLVRISIILSVSFSSHYYFFTLNFILSLFLHVGTSRATSFTLPPWGTFYSMKYATDSSPRPPLRTATVLHFADNDARAVLCGPPVPLPGIFSAVDSEARNCRVRGLDISCCFRGCQRLPNFSVAI